MHVTGINRQLTPYGVDQSNRMHQHSVDRTDQTNHRGALPQRNSVAEPQDNVANGQLVRIGMRRFTEFPEESARLQQRVRQLQAEPNRQQQYGLSLATQRALTQYNDTLYQEERDNLKSILGFDAFA